MRNLIAILGGLALMVVNAGCGSDGPSCGTGTVEVDGECVPSADPVTCATGTTLSGGECVPDGTVICETGTTFDSTNGTCVPDITGCAAGTVLVDGECVPYDDTLAGDVMEPAEPNGPEVGATIPLLDLPAEGESVVIEGCVEPRPDYDLDDNVDGDFDFYVFDVTAPGLVQVTVDGVGGMAGAFNLVALDGQLGADGWGRLGINLVGDTVQRQIYLPKAGQYLLAVADSRSLFLGQGFGDGTTTCYFATVAHLAMPTPTAISGTNATGMMTQDAQFFSYTPADGDMIDVTLDIPSQAETITGSIVTVVDGAYRGSAETASPANDSVAGLAAAQTLVYVVESSLNYGLTPVDFSLDLDVTPAASLGAAATANTVTVDNENGSYFYFDAAAGDMVRLEMDGSAGADDFVVNVIGRRGEDLSELYTGNVADGWMRFATPGRYTLQVVNNDTTTGTASVDFTRTHVQPGAMTFGTPVTGATLGAGGNSFFNLTLTNAIWLAFNGTPTGFGDEMIISIVDAGLNGPLSSFTDLTDGAQAILGGGSGDFVIWVWDTDFGSSTSPTFDVTVGNQVFTNNGTATESTPVDLNGVTLAADAELYYFNTTNFDGAYTFQAQGAGLDLIVEELDEDGTAIDSTDDGAAGEPESFEVNSEVPDWFAVRVYEATGTAGTVDIDVTAVAPTYATSISDIDLVNPCLNGTRVDFDGGGATAPIDLGFTFPFYGVDKTQMVITPNGWLTFDTAFAGGDVFDTFDMVGPYATDNVVESDVCYRKTATSVTVQWRMVHDLGGFGIELPVQFQAVLNMNGNVEFRYGPNSDFFFTGFDNYSILVNADDTDSVDFDFGLEANMQVVYTPN